MKECIYRLVRDRSPLSQAGLLIPAILIAVIHFVFYSLFYHFPLSGIIADSHSYFNFDHLRTSLYPAFLDLCQLLRFSLQQIFWVQILAYSISLFALCLSFLYFTGNKIFSLFVILLGTFLPYMNRYHSTILTESLYFTFLLLFLSTLLQFCKTRSAIYLSLLSLLAGLACAIRPIGVSLLPTLFLVSIYLFRSKIKDSFFSVRLFGLWTVTAILPLLLIILAERSYYRLHHTGHRTNSFQLHSFAKAALIGNRSGVISSESSKNFLQKSNSHRASQLSQFLAYDMQPVRDFIHNLPNLRIANRMRSRYAGLVQWYFPFVYKDIDGKIKNYRGREYMEQVRFLFLVEDVAFARIFSNSVSYLSLLMKQYIGFWGMDYMPHLIMRGLGKVKQQDIAKDLPYKNMFPPTEKNFIVAPFEKSFLPVLSVYSMYYLSCSVLGVGSLLLALLGLYAFFSCKTLRPLLIASFACALIAQSMAVLTVLTAHYSPRFFCPTIPFAFSSMALFALNGFRVRYSKKREGS